MQRCTIRRLIHASAGIAVLGLIVLVLLPWGAGAQGVFPLFASPAGTGTQCTPDEPCPLPTALDKAMDGCAIYLAKGTYTGAGEAVIVLTKSLTLFGGWDATNTDAVVRDPEAYPTIIDAEEQRRGVIVGEGITVTLDGFTVANGRGVGEGAGLHAHDADLTLRDMVFSRNAISPTVGAPTIDFAHGGGAFVQGGTLLVDGSTFLENSGRGNAFGGGLAISATVDAVVTDSLFQDNDAWWGSGLFCRGPSDLSDLAPLHVRSSRFIGNGHHRGVWPSCGGGYGSGLEIWLATARVEDSVFTDNYVVNSGTVSTSFGELLFARNTMTATAAAYALCLDLRSSSPFTVTNNVFADNIRGRDDQYASSCVALGSSHGRILHNTFARNGGESAIDLDLASSVALVNNIVVSHTIGITVAADSTATLAGTLWGEGTWANGVDVDGEGTVTSTDDLHADPGFVAPEAGDYHITADSAAVDAGGRAGVYDDIDGDERSFWCPSDIGADEVPGLCTRHGVLLPMVVTP